MADLDSLYIRITADAKQAEKSINGLITSLRSLEKAMNIGSLNTFVARLNSLTKAASSMNANGLKDLAKAMGDLSKAGNNLSNFGKTANQMSKVSNQAKTMADKISKEWGVSASKNVNSLAMAIENLYSAAGNDAEVGKALSVIEKLIKEYARIGKQADETRDKVRQLVSATKIYVPPTMKQEWGDDYKKNMGILGIKNTTTDPTKGVDIQSFMSEIKGMYGNIVPDTNNVEDALSGLVNYLSQGEQSVMSYKDAINQGAISTEYLNDTLQTLAESVGSSLSGSMQALVKAMQEGSASMDDIRNKMSEMSNVSSGGATFEGLANALSSLDGIDIPDFSNLMVLSQAASKLGSQSAGRAGQAMKDISAGLQALQNTPVKSFGEEMTTLTAQLRAIGSSNVVNASKSLGDVAKGLTAVGQVGDVHVEGLAELASALSMFGRKSAQDAVTTIPKLASAFRDLISTLSAAPNISQKVIDLATAMGNLMANVKSMPSASAKATKQLSLWGGHAQKAQKSTFSLAATFGKLYASYWAFLRLGKWFGSSISLASDLIETQNVVDNVFGDMSYKMEDFAKKSVDTLGMSELTAKKIASRFQAMGVNMGVPKEAIQSTNDFLQAATRMGDGSGKAYADVANSMADISLNLTKLAGDMASLYNQDYEDIAKDLESVMTGMTRPLRKYGLDLTNATLKEWALKNGMDGNIKTMTQYEKMLLRYQYVMANTTAAHGDFIKTYDTWANQIRIAGERMKDLKRIIGTIGINAFKPLVRAFNNAMNTIIHLADATLNSLGKIFGWKVEIKDVGLAEEGDDFADSMEDAAGSAKKMKDYMLGIDELNVFNEDNGSGGSGGGGGGGGAVDQSMVKWEETEKAYDSIYDTLYKLGAQIAKVQKEWLQGIDWDAIYEKAEKFGKGLASFLNGYLADAELFYEKGRFVANTINTIGHALKAFAEEFDGYQLGVDIGSWINGFTYNLDWETLNKAAYEIAHDLASAINGMVKTTDWTMVGSTIANALNLAIKFASTLINETDFVAIGKALGEGLTSAIKTFDEKEAARLIRGVIKGAIDLTSNFLKNTDFAELGRKIGRFLKELHLSEYIDDIAGLIKDIVVAGISAVGGMLLENPLDAALVVAFGVWKFTQSSNVLARGISTAIGTAISNTVPAQVISKFAAMWASSGIIATNLRTDIGAFAKSQPIAAGAGMIGTAIAAGTVTAIGGYHLGNAIAQVYAKLTGDQELYYAATHVGEMLGVIFSDGFLEGCKQIGAGIEEMFKYEVNMDGLVSQFFPNEEALEILGVIDKTSATWNDVLENIRTGVIQLTRDDFETMKETMKQSGASAGDAIAVIGQLEAAQNQYNAQMLANAAEQAAANDNVSASFSRVVESHDLLRLSADGLINSSGNVVLSMSELQKVQDYNTMSADEAYRAYQREFGALTDLDSTMTAATRTVSSFSTGMNGMPSGIMQVSSALDTTVDSTEMAKAQTEEFQNLWTNYTISNIDISQLEEINTVLKDINDTSKQLVGDFETNFGAIFSSLKTQLENSKGEITNFDTEINDMINKLFNETLANDFTDLNTNFGTMLTQAEKDFTTFEDNLNKSIDTLFDETMPTKFETLGKDFGTMLTDNEKSLTDSLGNVEKAIGGTVDNVQKKLETFLGWFDKNILDKTKAAFWDKALGELSGVFETAFRGVANTIATIINSLIEQINSAMNVKWDNLVVNGQTVMAAGQAKLFEIQPIPLYERGGFPEDGLFFANSSEMVGRFTNGRTAVANNEQIVGGIREGVQEAMSDVVFNMLNPYLSDIAQSSRETANKDFSVNIGDRDIAMASNRGQSLVGMSIIS